MKPISEIRNFNIQLGSARYSALAIGEGPIVLCLHGFPDTLHTWSLLAPRLAADGYRAIAIAMPGYEPSTIEKEGRYGVGRLTQRLLGWMDALGVQRAHLIGHDWGAVVGYAAAASQPERFISFTAMAIPHPREIVRGVGRRPQQLWLSRYMALFQLRRLSERALLLGRGAYIDRLWRRWSPGWEGHTPWSEAAKEALGRPGVARAALGYYRSLFALQTPTAPSDLRLLMRPTPVPTLRLVGQRDGCMDSRLFKAQKRLFPNGQRLVVLPRAGHFAHLEEPEAVADLVLDWLKAHC